MIEELEVREALQTEGSFDIPANEVPEEEKKSTRTLSNLLSKTASLSKRVTKSVHQGFTVVSENVQHGAQVITEKAKNDSYARRMKKYAPLFPKEYRSKSFNRPNMIIIRDDAERRGIDVCEGAIGWLNSDSGMEILYLYDEAVKKSGICFVPAATCDAVYYVDSYDRNRYIQLDSIFDIALREKVAELEHVAYCLGAKSFSVEIEEETAEKCESRTNHSTDVDGKNSRFYAKENADMQSKNTKFIKKSAKNSTVWEGNREAKEPELKWFSNDDTIKCLIRMRLEEANTIKSKTLILSGASSATMSKKTACAIDSAISKLNARVSSKIEQGISKEERCCFVFSVEF